MLLIADNWSDSDFREHTTALFPIEVFSWLRIPQSPKSLKVLRNGRNRHPTQASHFWAASVAGRSSHTLEPPVLLRRLLFLPLFPPQPLLTPKRRRRPMASKARSRFLFASTAESTT